MNTRRPVFRELLSRELLPVPEVLGTFKCISRLSYPAPVYPILFDSATASDSGQGRLVDTAGEEADDTRTSTAQYSFLAAAPRCVVRAKGRQVAVHDLRAGTVVQREGRGLDIVTELLYDTYGTAIYGTPESRTRLDVPPELPPFCGGAAGYVGYEYGHVLERIPTSQRDDLSIPDVVMGVYDWVVAWDHHAGRAWVVGSDTAAVDAVAEHITRDTVAGGSTVVPTPATSQCTSVASDVTSTFTSAFTSTFTPAAYADAVDRIRTDIQRGEIFQANLSQRFSAPFTDTPWTLYRRLRALNPAPFASYFDFGDGAIVSASPERFLWADASGRVETRPIKGTRPRAASIADDDAYRDELLRSEKDAAEHVMIVDVLRNDLSRVCEYGSVRVPVLRAHEAYATVHHLVSTVTGQLRPRTNAVDLLHAAFPGGSITGAPKIRAMEIIAELEPVTRGVYCGSIGYLSATGAMDTSIAIRTCVVKDGRVSFSAGGGIIADSDPADEYHETIVKAQALMQACAPCVDSGTV